MPGGVIQCVSFNATQDCFCVGLDNGLRVFSVQPLTELLCLHSSIVGSVRLCRMLHRTNLIALVGGGPYAKFADNTVLIWDAQRSAFVLELTFASAVLNVLIAHNRLLVVLHTQLHVFSFPNDVQKLVSVDTRLNTLGLCALCTDSSAPSQPIVFPARKQGSVQVLNMSVLSRNSSAAPVLLEAHESALVALCLSNDGALLVTGSSQGTVLRVFDVRKRSLLSELRRGSDPASLQCVQISLDNQWVCVSSDKGTVHVFAARPDGSRKTMLVHRTQQSWQQVGIQEGQQRSRWQFSPCEQQNKWQCAFLGNQTVVCINVNGHYHKYTIKSDSANPHRVAYDRFLEIGDDKQFWQVNATT